MEEGVMRVATFPALARPSGCAGSFGQQVA